MLELIMLLGRICILLAAQDDNFSKLQVHQHFSCKSFAGHKTQYVECYMLNMVVYCSPSDVSSCEIAAVFL